MLKEENLRKIFGFRSKTGWKSTVAVSYLLFCFAYLFIAIVTPPLIECSVYDTVIYKISSLVIFFWLISPFILLSETKLRDWLPFFNKRYSMSSFLGLMVASLLFLLFFIGVESYHSEEYKNNFRDYINTTYDNFYNYSVED